MLENLLQKIVTTLNQHNQHNLQKRGTEFFETKIDVSAELI